MDLPPSPNVLPEMSTVECLSYTVWLCPVFDHPDPLSLTLAEICVSLFVKCFLPLVVLNSSSFLELE